jgi:hypothetical protein
MSRVTSLRVPDLPLGRAGLQRVGLEAAREHRQLLVRGVSQSVQRDFLGAWIGWFGGIPPERVRLVSLTRGGNLLVAGSRRDGWLLSLTQGGSLLVAGSRLDGWLVDCKGGIWSRLSHPLLQGSLSRVWVIGGRLLASVFLGLLDQPTLTESVLAGELRHGCLLLAA